jgi:threonine aldolase
MTSPIDLRSDTVTRPGKAMRQAIMDAEVGDDTIDVDPTVQQLEQLVAELLGKEAAIFMPSGTMTNQVALRLHCRPGEEFLCEAECHIVNYEQGGYAQLSGLVPRTVTGDNGVLRQQQLAGLIRPENEHFTRTRLVCLENTHNRGGGSVQPWETVVEICDWAHEQGLRTHLDGARLFNAVTATGIPADQWGEHFDTVSICFSKGLGAPVGSALVGSDALIREARRHRKLFGGGMRQAGVIAAGALYALQHNRERLLEDHQHAQLLAEAVHEAEGLELVGDRAETNMVIFQVDPQLATAAEFVGVLAENGVQMLAIDADRVRAVTHLDVHAEQIDRATGVIVTSAQNLADGSQSPVNDGAQY